MVHLVKVTICTGEDNNNNNYYYYYYYYNEFIIIKELVGTSEKVAAIA